MSVGCEETVCFKLQIQELIHKEMVALELAKSIGSRLIAKEREVCELQELLMEEMSQKHVSKTETDQTNLFINALEGELGHGSTTSRSHDYAKKAADSFASCVTFDIYEEKVDAGVQTNQLDAEVGDVMAILDEIQAKVDVFTSRMELATAGLVSVANRELDATACWPHVETAAVSREKSHSEESISWSTIGHRNGDVAGMCDVLPKRAGEISLIEGDETEHCSDVRRGSTARATIPAQSHSPKQAQLQDLLLDEMMQKRVLQIEVEQSRLTINGLVDKLGRASMAKAATPARRHSPRQTQLQHQKKCASSKMWPGAVPSADASPQPSPRSPQPSPRSPVVPVKSVTPNSPFLRYRPARFASRA